MMRFDSATFSFLALFVIKSKKKLKVQNLKKVSGLRSEKNFKTIFCLSSSIKKTIYLQDLKSFVGQYWLLNSEKKTI